MTTPDGEQTAVPVPPHVPLDLVIELVESRIRQRRRASIRWGVGIAIALISVTLGAATLVFNQVFNDAFDQAFIQAGQELQKDIDERLREETRERAPARLGYLRAAESFSGAPSARLGITVVELDYNQRAPLALQIDASGRYRIDVIAVDADLDPVVYLYQRQINGIAFDAIDYDDDSGDGFNSRIERRLDANTPYYLEIEEISGISGDFNVAIQRLDE